MRSFYNFLLLITIMLFAGHISLGQLVINEYSAANLTGITDNYNHHEDWIEIYNGGSSQVNLGGYYLSDNPDDSLKWQFPDGATISAGGFLKVFADGRDEYSGGNYHSNFRLTQTKDNPEVIRLSNSAGEAVDVVLLRKMQKDQSQARKPDGSDNWVIFTNPTAGTTNNSAVAYTSYAEKPVMSQAAGFYDGPIEVDITTTEPNAVIRYTQDGSDPTTFSPVFSGPITVSATTIVKATTFSNNSDIFKSFIEFNTYFIDDYHTMAVMSCSSDQLDNLLNGNGSLHPFGTFEYFNVDGERTNIGYGEFNEHGQDSWVHPQRSIDYISRDECGYNYALREPMIPITDREEFQRVILRAAGDDNYPGIDSSALLRDYLVQNTATINGMYLDCRKGQKGVLYCNGTYWGVYGFREKVSDHDYTEYYYDQGKYDIYYLMLWGGSWAEYGGQAAWNDWNDLHDFIKYNDMADPENYNYVTTRLDPRSLVDYVLMNSYVVCSDWINWNVGWWRGTNPNGQHQRWGYTLWDEDATFNHYINYTGVPGTLPIVSPCYPEGLTNDPEEHIVMLNHLLDNEEFYTYYVSRYIDLYNTAFRSDNMINYLDTIESYMAPEMPNHVARWGGSMQEWHNNVQKIRNFINTRFNYLPTGLKNCYNLTGPYEFNVAISPPGSGQIRLNSLTIQESSWGGYYFGGIDTHLEAIEISPNFTFDHWELYNNTLIPSDTVKNVTVDLVSGDLVTAVFAPVPVTDSLVINEINYNSDASFDTEDWVEFYNPHDYILDITGWQFKDEDDTHIFEFPVTTVMPPHGYLVLCRDSAAFHALLPDIDNYLGDMGFGLNSAGELIRLYNADGLLVDTVHFDNDPPWPTEPDGNGPTLELKYWALDNALPENWVASEDHGTPGAINSFPVYVKQIPTKQTWLSFVIYPNPVADRSVLQVTSPETITNGEMIIYNVFGKIVKSVKIENSDRLIIERRHLPEGIYLCKLIDHNRKLTATKRFIVR